jgi:hypothetical protein
MGVSDEPRVAADYRAEDAEQVVALCLTLATILGDLVDELCIVGGLVPSMICDAGVDPSALEDGAHVGTLDLDVVLEVSVLDDAQYKQIAARLRTKGFAPDRNERGNEVRQRWRWGEANVTVDFLIPPAPGVDPDDMRVQSLEQDFAALVVMPLALAFHEPVERRLKGQTLLGDEVVRTVRFCGPGAFVVLKAYALAKRGKDKDAYDLVYVLQRWPGGILDVAARTARHAQREPEIVATVLRLLDQEFATDRAQGPRAASRFHDGTVDDDRVADAYGAVRDFLDACADLGVAWSRAVA